MQPSSLQAMHLTRERTYAASDASVSTEDQGKGVSSPTQVEACQSLATREGERVPESDVWLDKDISGTTWDRPGLHRVRELVQAQAIATVIVIDPDRLSRHVGHPLLLAEALEPAGVKWVIVSHPLARGPEGWLCVHRRGARAEDERATRLARTQRGRMGRAKAGHPWGQVPFGYRAIREPHGGHWEVDPEEAAHGAPDVCDGSARAPHARADTRETQSAQSGLLELVPGAPSAQRCGGHRTRVWGEAPAHAPDAAPRLPAPGVDRPDHSSQQ